MTRKELNDELLNKRASIFIPEVEDHFKCVYRAKARGEGLMINRERLGQIETDLMKIDRHLDDQARRDALSSLGITTHDYFHQYESDNPDNLSKEKLSKVNDAYYEKMREREKDLKDAKKPEVRSEAMCLAIGEQVKFNESRSWIPAKAMFGIHRTFITKDDDTKATVIGNVFPSIASGGKPRLKPLTATSIECMYGGDKFDVIELKVRTNKVICSILKDPIDDCKC